MTGKLGLWSTFLCVGLCGVAVGRPASEPGTLNPETSKGNQLVTPVTKLRIGIGLPMVVPADIDGNIRRMEPLVEEAAGKGARVVAFSECGINGYDLHGRGYATAFDTNAVPLQAVADMAKRHKVVLVVGFWERTPDRIYNTAAAIYPDGRRVFQRKYAIGEIEQAQDLVGRGPEERNYFEVDGFKCAMIICSDSSASKLYENMAAEHCDVLFHITAGAGSVSYGWYEIQIKTGGGRKNYLDYEEQQPHYPRWTIEQCMKFNYSQVLVNQRGWVPELGYFHPGCGIIVNRSGEMTLNLPGIFIFEWLRPEVGVGWVSKSGGIRTIE